MLAAIGSFGACVTATAASASLPINSRTEYTVVHSGKTDADVDTTALVALSNATISGAVNRSEADGKVLLGPGDATIIGPYQSALHMKTSSGNVHLNIIPGKKV